VPPAAHPGARIRHPALGTGVILRVLAGGVRVLARFGEGLPQVVGVAELEDLASGPAARPPRPVAARGLDRMDARQALEALRLGVVPPWGLDRLTVGRDPERAQLDALLDGDGTGFLLVEGHYGSGKSQMLRLAAEGARARGYAVAEAAFDPLEVTPSHPLRIYRRLIEGLRAPGAAELGLGPILDGAAGAPPHRWLDAAAFARRGPDSALAEDVLAFVSGQDSREPGALDQRLRRAGYAGSRLLGLPDYRTFGQMMAHLLGGVSAWVRAAGGRGLVVLLDEAELVDRLDPVGRALAEGVLRHLCAVALPDAALRFDEAEQRRGGPASHRAVPPRPYGRPELIAVVAITPDPVVHGILEASLAPPLPRMELAPLRASLLPVLAHRVAALARDADPALRPSPADEGEVARALDAALRSGAVGSARQVARLAVALWDLHRVDPARARAAARALSGDAAPSDSV